MAQSAVTGFHHPAIFARDWDAAVRFYEELGLEVDIAWSGDGMRAAYLAAADGACIEIFGAETTVEDVLGTNGTQPLLHVCLRSDDIDADLAAVVELGAKVTMEPTKLTLESTNGRGPIPIRICFFEGPSGELIELIEGAPSVVDRGDSSVTTGFHHWAVRAADWDAARRFYEDGLGMTVRFGWGEAPNRAIILSSEGGCGTEIFEGDPKAIPWPSTEHPGPLIHICLRTTDLDKAFAAATAHGAKVFSEPSDSVIATTTGHGSVPVRVCFLEGPTGEVIELLQGAG